jgi:thiol-disulfide isomerase/thioredoxin
LRGKRSLALGCGFAALLLSAALSANAQTVVAKSLVNHEAPEFVRRDLAGQSINLARLHGKVVLLNFWATWCAPCQIEMPVFARWQQQYGPQGLAVVGISMDDDAAPVRTAIQKLHIHYPVAMGDAALGQRYGGVLGLPYTFLIDRNGIVRAEFQGEVDLTKIEASLKNLLSGR